MGYALVVSRLPRAESARHKCGWLVGGEGSGTREARPCDLRDRPEMCCMMGSSMQLTGRRTSE